MTDEQNETAQAELKIKVDIMTDVIIRIPKELDIATLSGLLMKLNKIARTFASQDILTPAKSTSYYEKRLINIGNAQVRQNTIDKYPFLKSKDEFMQFYNKFKAKKGEERTALARQYDTTSDLMRIKLRYYYVKFLTQGAEKVKNLVENKQTEKKHHRWTQQEIQGIIRLKSEGKTAKEIAKIVSQMINKKVSDASIYSIIKEARHKAKREQGIES